MATSIMLVDDHPIVRKGLRSLLEAEDGLKVVGEAEDGLEALRLADRLHPDVLVLDLMMPGLNGLDTLPVLAQRCPGTRVVVLSMYDNEGFVLQALKNGAYAYVLKGCMPAHLVEAVRSAAAGRHYLSPPLSQRAIDVYLEKAQTAPADPHDSLTSREREVMQLAAEGYTSAEIAGRLFISPRTVEMHRASMMRKLGLRNQADLIRYALKRGMLPTEGSAPRSPGPDQQGPENPSS